MHSVCLHIAPTCKAGFNELPDFHFPHLKYYMLVQGKLESAEMFKEQGLKWTTGLSKSKAGKCLLCVWLTQVLS